jgi:hypothetical protein
MYTAAMIILWIAIGLTVFEIIAKIFVQNQDNNQEQNNNQENQQENKTE